MNNSKKSIIKGTTNNVSMIPWDGVTVWLLLLLFILSTLKTILYSLTLISFLLAVLVLYYIETRGMPL